MDEKLKNQPTKASSPAVQRIIFVCAGAVVLVGLAFALLQRSPQGGKGVPPRETREKRIDLAQIPSVTGKFLSSQLETGGKVYQAKTCQEDGSCVLAEEAGLPDHAWRLLAFTGLYASTKDQVYLGKMREALTRIVSLTDFDLGSAPIPVPDSFTEIWSLHQVYEAYQATKDVSFLDYFAKGIRKQDIYFNSHGPAAEWQKGPMLTSILARQYAQAASLTDDPQALGFLKTNGFITNAESAANDWRSNNLARASYLVAEAEKGSPDVSAKPADGRLIFEDQCFVVWAKQALAQLDASGRHAAETAEFFARKKFAEHKPNELIFGAIQSALPCIHVLRDLAVRDKAYERDLSFLVEQVLLPQWDSPDGKVCEGAGGFLALRQESSDSPAEGRSKKALCANNAIVTSDAAWATFVLSGKPGVLGAKQGEQI